MAINTYILEISNKCDKHCSFCYSLSYSPKGTPPIAVEQLGTDEWLAGIDRIVAAGGKAVDFSGGEPTMHPGFTRILQYAKERGLETIVSTNGSTIRNERIREALTAYADCISYSLHGQDAATHDAVQGRPGSYEKAMDSVAYFAGKTRVKVNTVACQQNGAGIDDIGEKIGVEHNDLVWKASKALLQRAGHYNRRDVEIPDEAFDALEARLKERYPAAYSSGRLLFRRPAPVIEPYVVVRSDGTVRVPQGDGSVFTGLYITDENLGERLDDEIARIAGDPESFAKSLLDNHDESYTRPQRSALVQIRGKT